MTGADGRSVGVRELDRSRSGSFRRSLRRRSRSSQPATSSEVNDDVDEWGKTKDDRAELIAQFKAQLAVEHLYDDKKHDDHALLRFLRARKYNLQLAHAMWSDSMKWRKEFGTDTILEDFDFQERKEFLQVYPQGYHKTDRKGRPIYVQHLGAINLVKIEQVTTVERMVKFHVQEYERCIKEIMPACSAAAGRHIDQSFVVLDVKGVGPRLLTGNVRKVIANITKIDQDNYPEMLGKTCIINAPAVFRFVWTVVRSMLDPRTASKIEICGTNYLPTLLKYCDAENLPSYLGGKSNATLIDDVGPWNRKGNKDAALEALREGGEWGGRGMLQSVASGEVVPRSRVRSDVAADVRVASSRTLQSGAATPAEASPPSPAKTVHERLQQLEMRMQHRTAADGRPVSGAGPPRTILGRLDALERSMALLLAAQNAAVERAEAAVDEGAAPPKMQARGEAVRDALDGDVMPSRGCFCC